MESAGSPGQSTSISYRGVEITLPPEVPFAHAADGTLTIDFGAGFRGKLTLRPGTPSSAYAAHWH